MGKGTASIKGGRNQKGKRVSKGKDNLKVKRESNGYGEWTIYNESLLSFYHRTCSQVLPMKRPCVTSQWINMFGNWEPGSGKCELLIDLLID